MTDWELLADHLESVGLTAAEFGRTFGCAGMARVCGILHDIGKQSSAFQDYLNHSGNISGPDHSTAGAREANRAYPGALGRLLAYVIAGHHAGLSDYPDLERRIEEKVVEPYQGWQIQTGPLPKVGSLRPGLPGTGSREPGFRTSFLTRMVFSCLVDADSLETERFVTGGTAPRGGYRSLTELNDRLRKHMLVLRSEASSSDLNALRAEVLDHAVSRASLAPGLFTLTVPTGGGKTLASLSFALEHAVSHEMRRIIYVIPFTSIIEQTASVFRHALGTDEDILEHHASFDWDAPGSVEQADSEGPDGGRKLRRASENWDVPIVVTTAVQFFESLFANRRSRCRKLHNLARSVIVLDEAQTLPVTLLHSSLAALQELAGNYGASVVVCTATQPAWRRMDGALPVGRTIPIGFDIGPDRELAPDPGALFARLRRVAVERRLLPVDDAEIAARFGERDQMLCIVNSRGHARALYELIAPLPGATHLTTLMCPRHRRAVLARARADLANGKAVRLVATSLIEAGVDIDFPEVWRATAGLDSIAQAAGRCNREGRAKLGTVVVFEPAHAKPPHDLKLFWQAAQAALRQCPDPLSMEAVTAYFRELYFVRGVVGIDAATLDGVPYSIMRHIAARASEAAFPFASIARAYRLIEDATRPVVVPWDEEARVVLDRVAMMDRPRADDLRKLQQYVVGLPSRARDEWFATGVLRPVNMSLGDSLLCFDNMEHYRDHTGVDLINPTYRSAENHIV